MAYIAHFNKHNNSLYSDIEERLEIIDATKCDRYISSRHGQKLFRGYVTRKHLEAVNKAAIKIQRYWRGYRDRKLYMLLLKTRVHDMSFAYYNMMATRIQKTWRGYYVRKYVLNLSDMLVERKRIAEANENMHNVTKAFRDEIERNLKKQQEQQNYEWCIKMLFKYHHLLRTTQKEGIYSLKNTTEYSEIEKCMLLMKFTKYMKTKRIFCRLEKEAKTKATHQSIFTGSMRRCEEAWWNRNEYNKSSLFASGEYMEEKRLALQEEQLKKQLLNIHDKRMVFGRGRSYCGGLSASAKDHGKQVHKVLCSSGSHHRGTCYK